MAMEMVEAALIPGLPDEIAEHCLLHLPFPHQSSARSVSSAWNRAISRPTFLHARKALDLSLPYVFVFAFHRSTLRLQWLALDPRSRRWFLLPPMPIPSHSDPPLSPSAFACAANATKGELFVLGGARSDRHKPLHTLISYKTSTNSWTVEESSMPTARSYFSAGSIGGKIIAAGGGGGEDSDSSSAVECYDPVTTQWTRAAALRCRISKYDSAVVGKKMYITEGWTWPFDTAPRGSVYDAEADCWGEMKLGLREGWTGSSVVLGEKLFVISECGECRVKVYSEEKDTWRAVIGSGVPAELRKPFAMAGLEGGRIYVVAAGMNVAVGTVEEVKGEWTVEWEVVEGPESFSELSPSVSQTIPSSIKPKEFLQFGMPLLLTDEKGKKSWNAITYIHRRKFRVTGGWREFTWDQDLKVGDMCDFSFLKGGRNCLMPAKSAYGLVFSPHGSFFFGGVKL